MCRWPHPSLPPQARRTHPMPPASELVPSARRSASGPGRPAAPRGRDGCEHAAHMAAGAGETLEPAPRVPLATIVREWGRIGCIGFGGPPAHVALLRDLCVQRRGWMSPEAFEHGVAATNLLPGPASTQLAVYCAWRLRGPGGAVAGGISFIVPGLALIILLAALFLGSPPGWIRGVGAGASAVVAAVAVHAGLSLAAPSRRRT